MSRAVALGHSALIVAMTIAALIAPVAHASGDEATFAPTSAPVIDSSEGSSSDEPSSLDGPMTDAKIAELVADGCVPCEGAAGCSDNYSQDECESVACENEFWGDVDCVHRCEWKGFDDCEDDFWGAYIGLTPEGVTLAVAGLGIAGLATLQLVLRRRGNSKEAPEPSAAAAADPHDEFHPGVISA